jgi:RimJ/RimL family protein N-acetyltransferase
VILEPMAPEHEAGLVVAARDGEIFIWLPVDLTGSEAMRWFMADALEAAARGRDVPYAILDAASGAPIGSTRFLEIRLEHLRVEIGWTWLAQSAWGTGANVEAKLMLLTHAFDHVGVRRVEFKTDARNERSRGALLALGAKFEGVLRKHMVVQQGEPRDSAYYSVIDDEWPALKATLLERLERYEAPRAGSRK